MPILVELLEKNYLCKEYTPVEFNRKLEGGVNVQEGKASQYRQFAMYSGIFLLYNEKIVSRNIFTNFLKFSIASRLLFSDNQDCNLEFIRELLKQFVEEAKVIYGKSILTYNMHSCIHLPDDYEKFGNLENINAFKFESYLGVNIKSVKSGYKPLMQIARHVDRKNTEAIKPKEEVQHKSKQPKHISRCGKVFKSVTTNKADACVQLKTGEIGLIQYIENAGIGVKLFNVVEDLFCIPVESSKAGIYKLNNLSNTINVVKISDIYNKLFYFPYKNYNIGVTFLH